MDEKVALQYREFYMRCLQPYWQYPHSKILEDFLASGLPYPNKCAISSRERMERFTGVAFGRLQLDFSTCARTRWCAQHLWRAKRCPFAPWDFEDHPWSGDTDLPKLP